MGKNEHQVSIFLVDDEPRVCKVMGETLRELHYEVRAFSNAKDCISALRTGSCDLIITDYNMPQMTGLELLQEVKRMRPLLPVIVITGYGDVPLAVKALHSGAADFLEKPLSEDELVLAVKEALRLHAASETGSPHGLTPTEMEVLRLIASGRTNKEIAQVISRSLRTVENHRWRLMQKLQVKNVADLVKIAMVLGLTETTMPAGNGGKAGSAAGKSSE
jgi:two-component system, LuxR family, response regulator FixJ